LFLIQVKFKIVTLGALEGSQSSNYVLFVSGAEGFKVLPVSKFYKFTQKPSYKTLTLDEAEEKMKSLKKKNDRWLMKSTDDSKIKDGKGSKPKEWKEKIMGVGQNS
jgi:transcription initiation factor TFIIF subunit alpha